MLKWMCAIIMVVLLTMPGKAQQVASAPVDIMAFSSPELLINCAAQFAMGDKSLIEKAVLSGHIFMVPKGTTIMGVEYDSSGIFSFMIKGKPGLYYSARQLYER